MKTVLVVDDDNSSVQLVRASLEKMGYASVPAFDGHTAITRARERKFDLILLDIEMPALDGFKVLEEVRRSGASEKTNVIMVTAHAERGNVTRALKLGAADFVVKPFDTGLFLHKVGRWINEEVEKEWARLKPEQEDLLRITLTTLDKAFNAVNEGRELPYGEFRDVSQRIARVVESGDVNGALDALKEHDSYTFVHSLRVGIFLSLFVKAFGGFDKDEIITLTTGGVLHDVGKAKTPLRVLNKAGSFDPEEWREMKTHVDHSVEALRRTPGIPEPVVEIAWTHHEKLDGTGYPRGLKADGIGTLARMSAIADVYVALTDRRVYKPGYPPEEAVRMMRNPNHLDQGLLDVFVGVINKLYGLDIA